MCEQNKVATRTGRGWGRGVGGSAIIWSKDEKQEFFFSSHLLHA